MTKNDIGQTPWLRAKLSAQNISVGTHEGKTVIFQRNSNEQTFVSILIGPLWFPLGYYWQNTRMVWVAKRSQGCDDALHRAASEEDVVNYLLEIA